MTTNIEQCKPDLILKETFIDSGGRQVYDVIEVVQWGEGYVAEDVIGQAHLPVDPRIKELEAQIEVKDQRIANQVTRIKELEAELRDYGVANEYLKQRIRHEAAWGADRIKELSHAESCHIATILRRDTTIRELKEQRSAISAADETARDKSDKRIKKLKAEFAQLLKRDTRNLKHLITANETINGLEAELRKCQALMSDVLRCQRYTWREDGSGYTTDNPTGKWMLAIDVLRALESADGDCDYGWLGGYTFNSTTKSDYARWLISGEK